MKKALIYFGDWTGTNWKEQLGYDAMLGDFNITEKDVRKGEVLFATYTYEDYSGAAFVLFQRDGKLYEVHGSHCSCYGLEGQWKPEETTWAALAMRNWEYNVSAPEAIQRLEKLIAFHNRGGAK